MDGRELGIGVLAVRLHFTNFESSLPEAGAILGCYFSYILVKVRIEECFNKRISEWW